MNHFKVDILSPSRVLCKDRDASSLLIPTVKGEINVLPDHTHIVSKLETGVLTISTDGQGDDHFVITTGICKVLKDRVTILTNVAEHIKDVDKDRAQKALEKSLRILNGEEALDEAKIRKYQRKKQRAEARLRAAYLK